jgi:FkbM family methyltransferase
LDGELGEKIEVVSIDNFMKENKGKVGLIKRDIEGLEYESVLGAEKTIKEDKPILLISIYHS